MYLIIISVGITLIICLSLYIRSLISINDDMDELIDEYKIALDLHKKLIVVHKKKIEILENILNKRA